MNELFTDDEEEIDKIDYAVNIKIDKAFIEMMLTLREDIISDYGEIGAVVFYQRMTKALGDVADLKIGELISRA